MNKVTRVYAKVFATRIYFCCVQYLIGVAQYTDVTVRYIPRLGGRYVFFTTEKKYIYFLFFFFLQTVVQKKKKKNHLDV